MSKSSNSPPELEITDKVRKEAESELREKKKIVDYDTKEYPVEVLVRKYREGLEEDVNELYVPDYQGDMAWDETRQSKFIESILLGLPISPIFVADLQPEENELGRLEIIDGTQRIRALTRFINNELQLCELKN